MIDRSPSSPDVLGEVSTRIQRRISAYLVSHVNNFLVESGRSASPGTDQSFLDAFTHHVEIVGASYDPRAIRNRDNAMVFQHLYDAARRPPGGRTVGSMELLTALLAAELEFRGSMPLGRVQTRQLAETYEWLARALEAIGLPAHAALAFRRAGGLYRSDEDQDSEDRCGLALARAKRLAQPARWRRIAGLFPDLVCGYGYRPFRMLAWMALQLLLIDVIVYPVSSTSFADTLYMVMVNYLNPLGLSDTESAGAVGRVFYVLESYLGIVTLSVFFALLVRRWFRL